MFQNKRLLIYAPDEFGRGHSKTAEGVLRYGRNPVVGIVDASRTGTCADVMGIRADVPFYPDVASALAAGPEALLLGVEPRGGRLPAAWRNDIAFALRSGLDIISGLHEVLAADPEFRRSRGTQPADLGCARATRGSSRRECAGVWPLRAGGAHCRQRLRHG